MRNETLMLILITLDGLTLTITNASYPTLLPEIMRSLKMSDVEAALLGSVPTFTLMIFHLIGGILSDHFGAKKTNVLGMIIISAFTFLCATANSFSAEVLTRIMVGAGTGLIGCANVAFLARWTSPKNLPKLMGIYLGGWMAGSGSALYLPIIIEDIFSTDWRGVYIIFSLIACVMTIIFFIMAKESPSEELNNQINTTLLSVLRVKEFWFIATAHIAGNLAGAGIGLWLPTILMEGSWNVETAALAASLGTLIAIPANISGGLISNKLRKRKPLFIISAIMLSLSTVLLGITMPSPMVWIAIFLRGWFGSFYISTLLTISASIPEIGPKKAGTSHGLVVFLSSFGTFSSTAWPLIQASTGSYFLCFMLSAFFSIFIVIPGILIRDTGL